MLKLKLQHFGHFMWRVDSLEKTDAGRGWGQEEKGTTEDEMAGCHYGLDGRKSEWTLGVGDGQGGLACCDSWGCKESDTTEQLNWTEALCHARCWAIYRVTYIISQVGFHLTALIYLYVGLPSWNVSSCPKDSCPTCSCIFGAWHSAWHSKG